MPNGWRRIEVPEAAKEYRRAYLKAFNDKNITDFTAVNNLALEL
jgi:hypothetical protein